MKGIKFIRNDTVKITLEKFIENGESFYIVIGKPSKLEESMAFSSLGEVEINSLAEGVVPKNIDPKKIAELTYSQIACHIVDTNLITEELTFETKCNLVSELDRFCPELIEYLQERIQKDINKIEEDEIKRKPKLILKK